MPKPTARRPVKRTPSANKHAKGPSQKVENALDETIRPVRQTGSLFDFSQDYTTSNPKLHALYVRWAYEELLTANEAIEQLSDYSRYGAGMMAGALHDARSKLILTDPSYRDAAALITAGVEAPLQD